VDCNRSYLMFSPLFPLGFAFVEAQLCFSQVCKPRLHRCLGLSSMF
jgi:hypothetical protein